MNRRVRKAELRQTPDDIRSERRQSPRPTKHRIYVSIDQAERSLAAAVPVLGVLGLAALVLALLGPARRALATRRRSLATR